MRSFGAGVLAAGLLVGVLGACTSPLPYGDADTRDNPRRSAAAHSAQAVVVAQLDGWWVLLTESERRPVCMVIRPGVGTAPPVIRGGYAVSGEGGFYMYQARHLDVPFFGFYGAQAFGESRAEHNGERYRYTDDRDTVLGWEGQQLSFEVWSDPNLSPQERALIGGEPISFAGQGSPQRPQQQLGEDAELTTGVVDFTGVTQAYQAMLDCHSD